MTEINQLEQALITATHGLKDIALEDTDDPALRAVDCLIEIGHTIGSDTTMFTLARRQMVDDRRRQQA